MFPSRPLKFLGIKFLGPTSRQLGGAPFSIVDCHPPGMKPENHPSLWDFFRETRLTIPQKAASWLIDQGQPPGLKSSAQTKSTPVPLRTCTNIWSKPESPGAGDVDIGWFSNLKTRNLTRTRLKIRLTWVIIGCFLVTIQVSDPNCSWVFLTSCESIDPTVALNFDPNQYSPSRFRRLQWVDIWSKPHFGLPNCTDDLYFHYINTSKQSNTIIS